MKDIRPEYAAVRIAICKACRDFNHVIKTCNHCGCFMPGKTLLKRASCPAGRWQAIDDDKTS